MKAILCDGCKKLLSEKDVEYIGIGIKRFELCKKCKEKATEINKWEEQQDNKLQEEYKNKLKEIGIEA